MQIFFFSAKGRICKRRPFTGLLKEKRVKIRKKNAIKFCTLKEDRYLDCCRITRKNTENSMSHSFTSVISKYTISRRCTPESLCISYISGSRRICVRFHGTCESVITNGSPALYRYVALRETVDTFATMRGRSGVTRNKRRKRGGRETRVHWNL